MQVQVVGFRILICCLNLSKEFRFLYWFGFWVTKGCIGQSLLKISEFRSLRNFGNINFHVINWCPMLTPSKMLVISHNKAQFLLDAKWAKPDSVSYRVIRNIKMLATALTCFNITITKNGHNINLIMVIALNAIIGSLA